MRAKKVFETYSNEELKEILKNTYCEMAKEVDEDFKCKMWFEPEYESPGRDEPTQYVAFAFSLAPGYYARLAAAGGRFWTLAPYIDDRLDSRLYKRDADYIEDETLEELMLNESSIETVRKALTKISKAYHAHGRAMTDFYADRRWPGSGTID